MKLTSSNGGPAINATVNSYNADTGLWTASVAANTLTDGRYTVKVDVSSDWIDGETYSTSGYNASTQGFVDVDLIAPVGPTFKLAQDTGISDNDDNSRFGDINIKGLEQGASWQFSTNGGSTWSNFLTAFDTSGLATGLSTFPSSTTTTTYSFRVLDAAGQFAISPELNIWAGRLLSPAMVAEATRLQSGWQGLGFEVVGEGALASYGHGGMAPGMNAHLRVYPQLDVTIVVLSNLDPPAAGLVYSYLHERMPIP